MGVEDGWVELATLPRLKRTPKLAQPKLLWDVRNLLVVNGHGKVVADTNVFS